MKTIYATEPVMHRGEAFMPGQSMECDDNEAAAIIGAGRGTQDEKVGAAAQKQYEAAVKAAEKRAAEQQKAASQS